MFTFYDLHRNKVELTFGGPPFPIEPKHVLVLVQKEGKWLCAINDKRGIEFPGGKVERDETLMEAAKREVYEETRVHITDLKILGHYIVYDEHPFCKVVFTARIERLDPFLQEHETSGRVFLSTDELMKHPQLSFYMKDEGMKMILQEVKHHEREWHY
ncbi:MAG: NUDIX domain-containing protein [Lysinibacillus sp.]|nr:NUDIX domain-containing protein [Lysinibacillus sp.]